MSSNQRKSQLAIDDNGIGVVSYRGWLYSADQDGRLSPSEATRYEKNAQTEERPIPQPILLERAPQYAEQKDEDRPSLQEELARLDKQERAAWEYQNGRYEPQMHRMTIPACDLVHAFRQGYTLIPRTSRDERGVTVVDVEGQEFTKVGLSYDEIAERMGATWRQVQRWLESARAKLRGEKRKR